LGQPFAGPSGTCRRNAGSKTHLAASSLLLHSLLNLGIGLPGPAYPTHKYTLTPPHTEVPHPAGPAQVLPCFQPLAPSLPDPSDQNSPDPRSIPSGLRSARRHWQGMVSHGSQLAFTFPAESSRLSSQEGAVRKCITLASLGEGFVLLQW
jgi:hypothetical protein